MKTNPVDVWSSLNSLIFLQKSPHDLKLLLVAFPHQQEADESLNFEEQILEAAKSIAAATSALVKAASAAQRELVAQGKVRLKQGWSHTQFASQFASELFVFGSQFYFSSIFHLCITELQNKTPKLRIYIYFLPTSK